MKNRFIWGNNELQLIDSNPQDIAKSLETWLEKLQPPREGLVPKSGSYEHPFRWIRPSKEEDKSKVVEDQKEAYSLEDFLGDVKNRNIEPEYTAEILEKIYEIDRSKLEDFSKLMSWWNSGGDLMRELNTAVKLWKTKYKDTKLMNAVHDLSQKALKTLYPSGKITLYKGMSGPIAQKLYRSADEKVTLTNRRGWALSSWSGSQSIAESFTGGQNDPTGAKSKFGIVLSMEIPIESIFISDEIWPFDQFSGQEEFLVMNAENFLVSIKWKKKRESDY